MNPNPGYVRISQGTSKVLRNFLGAVPGSVKHHLNTEELLRISATAATSGGGFFGFLQLVMAGAGTIFLLPAESAVAVAVLTLVLEARRRLAHGEAPGVKATAPRADGPPGTQPGVRQP